MKRLTLAAAATLIFNFGPALAAGAIAVDDQAGDKAGDAGYGLALGSLAEAKRDAVKFCEEGGNKNCEVVLTFGEGQCGGYASSRDAYGTGVGETKNAAAAAAMENCGSGCKLVVSDCDK